MQFGPLAGFSIGVTADRRAEEQATLLRRLGAGVVHGPVIRTLPLSGSYAVRSATEAVIADPPDVILLTTALGVRGWFGAAESLGLGEDLTEALSSCRVLARGPKAAGTTISHGVPVSWQAPTARGSEMVSHLAEIAAGGRPLRVAVQLDGSPTSDLAAAVRQAVPSAEVLEVPVYRWELPEDPTPALRLISSVAERSVDAVTFTAAHAVTNFAALATEAGVIDAVRVAFDSGSVLPVAVGPVTSARLTQLGLVDAIEPRTFRLGAMVQALAERLKGEAVQLRLAGHDVHVQGRLVAVADEEPVHLTDRERAVLVVLSRRPGVVVSKGELRDRVWGNVADDHAVEVTVGRLRRRLGIASDGIETVMRRGYRLAV